MTDTDRVEVEVEVDIPPTGSHKVYVYRVDDLEPRHLEALREQRRTVWLPAALVSEFEAAKAAFEATEDAVVAAAGKPSR